MISIKIYELLDSTEVLKKISQTELKAKLAFQISRLLKEADKEIQGFNETRMNLVKKYGEKDEKDELITDEKGNCKIIPEYNKQFQDELKDVLNTEIELNVNLLKLNDLDGVNFTPSEITLIEKFIDLEE